MSTNTYYSPFFPAPATAGAKGSTVAAVTTDAVGVIRTDVGNNTKAISDQKKVIDYLTTSGFTDGVAPSLPKDLSLTSVLTDAGVTLRAVWTANTEADVAGYVLAIKESSGNYVEFTTSSNSFERNALARNTVYTAKVAAYDKAGNRSGFSSEVTYTTVKDNVYPGNVVNPTLETTYNTAFIKWTNPSDTDLSSVRVILKNASNNAVVRDVAVASSGGTNGSATFTNLTAATYYFATLYTSDTSRNDNVDRGVGVNTPVIMTAGGLVVSDFTPGLSPIQTVTALPTASGYTGPSIVYYQGKLYRYTNGAWTSAVDGGDVVANTLPGTALVPTTNIPSTITVAGVTGSNTLSDAFKRADYTQVTNRPTRLADINQTEGDKFKTISPGATADFQTSAMAQTGVVVVTGNQIDKLSGPLVYRTNSNPNSGDGVIGLGIRGACRLAWSTFYGQEMTVAINLGYSNLQDAATGFSIETRSDAMAYARVNGQVDGATLGYFDGNTVFELIYDNVSVKMLMSGTVVRTYSIPAGSVFYPTFYLKSVCTVRNITWETYTDNAWSSTAGPGRPSDFASVGENIVRNPSLATDTTGWTLYGSVARVVRGSSDPANYTRSTGSNSNVSGTEKVPLSLGQKTLYYSYWRRLTSAVGGQQTFDINWFDGSGAYIGASRDNNFGLGYLNSSQTTPVNAPFNTWFLVTGSFEIPLGAAFVSWVSVFTNDANNPADFALPFMSTTEPSVSRNNKVATSDFGAAAGDNLILNGEFLDGLNNYTKSGSTLVATPGSSATDPLAFARMSGGGGDAALVSRSNQRVPVQAGRTVYFSGKFRSSKAGAQFVVSAYNVTAAGAYGGDMGNNNVFITAANIWQDFEFKAVVPDTAATAVVQWTAADPGSGNYSDIASLRMAYTQKGATVGAPAGTYVGLTPAEVVEIRSNDPATRINQNTVTVDGGKITADTVDAIQLKAGSVTTNKMTVNSILGDRIATNTLTADKITSKSITATQIAANTVTATEIAANTITANQIASNTISADRLTIGNRGLSIEGVTFQVIGSTLKWTSGYIIYVNDAGNTEAQAISAGSTTTIGYIFWTKGNSYLQPGSAFNAVNYNNSVAVAIWEGGYKVVVNYGTTIINGANITTNSITASQIAANTITANELSAGSITADKIATGAITIGGTGSPGNLYDSAGNPVNTGRLITNLIDLTGFVPGATSPSFSILNAKPAWSGSPVLVAGISGASEIALKCTKDGSDAAYQGGFQVDVPRSQGFDPAKTYRYTMWVKNDYVSANSGFFYMGAISMAPGQVYSASLGSSTPDQNPYWNYYTLPSTNKWYLAVGIIHGTSYTGPDSGTSGIYDPATGQKVLSGNDLRYVATATDGGFRAFQYYGESGKATYFSRLKMEEVTSATPSIAQMMATVGAPAGTYVGTTLSTDVEKYANDPAARVNANVTTISGGKITTGTITALQIAANTITSSQIAANTITSNQIAANTIGASNLVAATRPISGIGFNFRVDTDGTLRWDNGTLYMIDNAGNQQIASIPASGIAWTGNPIYIVKYNQGSNNNFDALENRPDILNNSAYTPIAIWSSPKVFTTLIGVGTLINGDGIVTGSVNADRIKARTITADRLATNSITANEIATGTITAAQIAAGAIRADKLAVGNGGSALNDGSDMSDSSAWQLFQGSFGVFKPISNGQAGAYAMESAGYGVMTWINGARRISIDTNKTYRIHMWARTVDGSGSSFYGGVAAFDASGNNISADGSQWLYSPTNVTLPSSWTEYNFVFGAGTSRPFPVNARTISPLMILSYGGGNSLHQVQDVRIEEVLPSTLIQDGAITTNKITVNSLNGDRIQAGTLSADKIAANTVLAASVTVNSTPLGTTADQAANSANTTLYCPDQRFYSYAGNKITKLFQTGWDTNTYTLELLTGASIVSGKLTAPSGCFIGLTDNRSNGNYGLINYSWHRSADGNVYVYTGGSQILSIGTYSNAGGDGVIYSVVYDGRTVRWYRNEYVHYELAVGSGRQFSGAVAIYNVGQVVTNFNFLPGADNSLTRTDPAARINSGPSTQIDPGKVLISGGTSLSNWRQGGDETRIAGGSISANTISANKLNIGNRNVSTIGLNFEWNPNNNYVYWSNGYFYYQDDNGNSVQTYISEGNSGGAGAHQFFYWIKGEGIIRMTQDVGTPTGNDRIMIGAWWGGTNLNINIGGTIIHGDRITTGTITANRLNVASLSSITANVGELTAGTIRNQDSSTIMDLNNGVFQFNINTFRLHAPGYTIQYPFEFANGSLKMKNVAIEGGSLTDVSINTNKLVNNSVTRNAYMVVPSGGTLGSYPQNQWTTFDTGNGGSSSGGYAGSGGGGGTAGGGGSGGGTTRNVQLQ